MKKFLRSKILNRQSALTLFSILPRIAYLKLLYDTSENGILPYDFHQYCNGIYGTLVIVRSTNGKIAGGYTDKNWGEKGKTPSEKTFLFSVDNKRTYQIKNQDIAIYCHENEHPSFGCLIIRSFAY